MIPAAFPVPAFCPEHSLEGTLVFCYFCTVFHMTAGSFGVCATRSGCWVAVDAEVMSVAADQREALVQERCDG